LKALSFLLKCVITRTHQLLKTDCFLGSYVFFAFANYDASTHTNYLIELLKNDSVLR